MRKPINLFSDSDPSSLAATLEAIDKSRRERSAAADFESYLDFLEQTSALFGFVRKERSVPPDIPDSNQPKPIL